MAFGDSPKSMANQKITTERKVHEIDAAGQTVGRLASSIIRILRGKNKPSFSPHLDIGDFVNIRNASKLKFTGKKLTQKVYFRFTGYPRGLKETKMMEVFKKNPGEVLRRAVKTMLPANKLRNNIMKRLKISD